MGSVQGLFHQHYSGAHLLILFKLGVYSYI
jgi:hypothetical protein